MTAGNRPSVKPLSDDELAAAAWAAIARETWDPVSRLWIERLLATVDAARAETEKWRLLAETYAAESDPGLTADEFKAKYIDQSPAVADRLAAADGGEDDS